MSVRVSESNVSSRLHLMAIPLRRSQCCSRRFALVAESLDICFDQHIAPITFFCVFVSRSACETFSGA